MSSGLMFSNSAPGTPSITINGLVLPLTVFKPRIKILYPLPGLLDERLILTPGTTPCIAPAALEIPAAVNSFVETEATAPVKSDFLTAP